MKQLETFMQFFYTKKLTNQIAQKNVFHSLLKQCYCNEQPVYKETYTVKLLPL